MKFELVIEADDLAEVVAKLSSCTSARVVSFVPVKEGPKRGAIGKNPRIRTPDDLTGQAAFTYSLFDEHEPRRQQDVAEKFGKQYPHLANPFNSLSPLIRTLAARGFLVKTDATGYRKVVSK